ncbi:MAG: S8 family serine peptidase [Rhizobacter sp.]|nr:S8 family serine peptidase [Rhizobacter sp.]
MRKLLIRAAVAGATLLGALPLQALSAQGSTVARVIVKYRADSALLRKQALSVAGQQALQASALGNRIGVTLDAGRAISERSHVVFARGMTSQQLAAKIAAQSDIEYAAPDERKHIVAVPNDPLYTAGPAVGATSGGPATGQWYLRPPPPAGAASSTWGKAAPSSINAERAWDLTTGSTSIVVAVLDTGVRFDHPDLQGGNVLPGYDMISADPDGTFTSAGDGNGRDPDASDPGDFVNAQDSAALGCPTSNSSWHGTQTLGLIGAATDNSLGMASVGHGNIKVMPVRVLGKCGGFDSDIQAGILWAAGIDVPGVPHNTNPARVINMSLGGTGTCAQGYIDAIGQANAAGAVVVVAGGNGGSASVGTPANCPGAIGVAGLRQAGDLVGYSDAGPEITIAAPAGNCPEVGSGLPGCSYPILTTTNTGTTTPVVGAAGASYTDSFTQSLGTSFSAPLVSGTVALMLSVQPTLTPAQVRTKLMSSARPFVTSGGVSDAPTCPARSPSSGGCYCTTSTCGAGMLDAHAAVAAAAGVQAGISLTTTTPTANQAVVLTSTSVVGPGRTIASYQWSILNAGTTGATITGASNGATVTVTPTAAGSFVIQLVVTDDLGASATTTLSVAVVSGVVTPPTSSPAGGGSKSGGGAIDAGWLALLLGAVAALAVTAPRERARRVALSAAWRRVRSRGRSDPA